jgi:hypothetical protein
MTNKKGSSTNQALRARKHLACTCGNNVDTVGKPCNKVLRCCGAAAPCQESHVYRRLRRAVHGTLRCYQMSALQSSLVRPLKHWSKLPNTAPPPRVFFHKQKHTSTDSPPAHRRAQLHTQPTCIAIAFLAASKSEDIRLNGWSLVKLRVRTVMRPR